MTGAPCEMTRPLLLLCAVSSVAQARVEVQGHRGARAVRPENTLVAFEYALGAGVDVLELDLGVTADDQLVVLHDQAISPMRCTLGGKKLSAAVPVRSLDLAAVRRFECGSLPHERFPLQERAPGAGIPTLAEVFAVAKDSKVGFNIETKLVPGHDDAAPAPERFAELVVQAVRAAGMVERTTVQSFDQRTLQAVARLEPTLRRVLLVAENHIDHVAAAKAAQASIVSPNHLWIVKADVARMHAAGLKVVPWTANTPQSWARLVEMGVDGIITDDPAALAHWLKARGLR